MFKLSFRKSEATVCAKFSRNPVPKLEEEEVLPMVAIFFTQSRPNKKVILEDLTFNIWKKKHIICNSTFRREIFWSLGQSQTKIAHGVTYFFSLHICNLTSNGYR